MIATSRVFAVAAIAAVLAGAPGLASRGASASSVEAAAQGRGRSQAQWQDVIRNLRHPDPKVRLAAVEALGNAGYLAAIEPLAPLIGDPDNRVQFAAIDTELTFFLVDPIGNSRIQSFLGSGGSRALEAFNAGPFERTASPAPAAVVDGLIAAVRDDNDRIRFDAIHAVGVIAQPPLTPSQFKGIVDQLDHYDPVIRAATARVLGRLRVREAGTALINGMNDSNAIVRQFAIESLGLIREERAVTSLLDFVKHYGKGEIAASSMLALARIGHASALELFRARIADSDPAIRAAAAEGLGRLADRDSLGQLHSMVLADPIPSVRLAAAFAVYRMGEPRLPLLMAGLTGPTAGQAADYLLELGSSALTAAQTALSASTDPRQRVNLIHLLGFIGGADTVPVLQPIAKDKDERAARAAANAIARLSK